nr:MAG TPA: YvrJ protein family protein [Caudoviricetes sp.]
MDVNDIVTLIGSLGFPIVACVGMFYLYNRTLKDFTSTLSDIASEIRELREELKELIKNA